MTILEVVGRICNRGGDLLECEMEWMRAADAVLFAADRLAQCSDFSSLFVLVGCIKALKALGRILPGKAE